MGLGVPGEVISIHGTAAIIDCWGTQREVRIEAFVDVIVPGDFVIEHEGVIVRRIPDGDVDRTIELYESVLAEA
jgi:hydrogenase expression/formation protein HypC